MDYLFEEFVGDTTGARSEAELFEYLTKALALQGYEKIVFSIFNEPDIPAAYSHFGYYKHAVDDWNALYFERGFDRIDPVVQAIKSGARAFAWNALPNMMFLTRAQRDYMEIVGEMGMHQGIAIALGGGRSGLGASTADRHDRRQDNVALVRAICTHFYEAFRELKTEPTSRPSEFKHLSIKERQVLIWVAIGKTDCEIADILTISQKTVDAHLRNIYRKLNASNRVTAVIRGLKQGYITL